MANSIIGWEKFVREHPDSEYSEEAQDHIARLRKLEEEKLAAEKKRKEVENQRTWDEAKTAGTIWSYAAYLEKLPEGKHKSDAKKEFSSALETMVKKLSGGKNSQLLPGSAFPIGAFTVDEVKGALGKGALGQGFSSTYSDSGDIKRHRELTIMQMISLVGLSQSGRLMFARKPEGSFVVLIDKGASAENGTSYVNVGIKGDGYAIVDDVGRKTVYEFRWK